MNASLYGIGLYFSIIRSSSVFCCRSDDLKLVAFGTPTLNSDTFSSAVYIENIILFSMHQEA